MIYTINKNFHFSLIWGFIKPIWFTFNNQFNYQIKFDINCLYNLNPIDNWDINKLIGFSTHINHHQQSCRLGWRCLDQENIELVTYCYDEGFRLPEEVISRVKPGEEFNITLQNNREDWVFVYHNKKEVKVLTIKKSKPGSSLKYLLFPFFGGNNKSPQKMTITLNRIKNGI